MPVTHQMQPDWVQSVTEVLEAFYREIILEKEAEDRASPRGKRRRALVRRIVSQI
jgi:hypothetical protein